MIQYQTLYPPTFYKSIFFYFYYIRFTVFNQFNTIKNLDYSPITFSGINEKKHSHELCLSINLDLLFNNQIKSLV